MIGNKIINIPTYDYKILNINVDIGDFIIPIFTSKIISDRTLAFRNGYYASSDENGMITVYISKSTIQLVQAYKNGKDVLDKAVIGIKYK